MKFAPALLQEIQNEMTGVKKVTAIGMSFASFQNELTRFLGQMDVDREKLVHCGMDESLIEKGHAYLYLLAEVQAARNLSEGTGSKASREFDALYPKILKYYELLFDAISFIATEIDDPSLVTRRNDGITGKSKLNRIDDVIYFLSYVQQYPEVAAQIKFDGITLDETFLKRIDSDTHRIVDLYSENSISFTDRSQLVLQKKQLFMLCKRLRKKVRHYAKAAFIKDKEYFREHYKNKVYHARYKKKMALKRSKPSAS